VAYATARRAGLREYTAVPEIVIPTGWRERLEALTGRRRDYWIVAGVSAVAVAAALLLWTRGAPAKIAPPATSAESVAASSPAPASPASAVLVHVAGAVKKPGVYEFPAGARVADAVDSAQPRGDADLNVLNLAEPLTDAMKIDVPRRGEQTAMPAAPTSTAAPSSSPGAVAVVNVNTADQIALETIPGIGPVTAAAIIDYRTQAGQFTSIEQLLEVSGIGPATLESIRPYVTI
jgi:competence protein ComEA